MDKAGDTSSVESSSESNYGGEYCYETSSCSASSSGTEVAAVSVIAAYQAPSVEATE